MRTSRKLAYLAHNALISVAAIQLLGFLGSVGVAQTNVQATQTEQGDILTSLNDTFPSSGEALKQSNGIGESFSERERCFHLFRLADAALQLNTAAGQDMAREWSMQLLRKAGGLEKTWDRGAFQKNAVVTLSGVDPLLALRMISSIDRPDLTGSQLPPEDLRAFGARTIFTNVISTSGLATLSLIREQARYIGETGEYPYTAMSKVADEMVRARREAEIPQIAEEALHYYESGPRVRTANSDFEDLVISSWPYIDSSLRLTAVRQLVYHLAKPESRSSSTVFAMQLTTASGNLRFSSENRALLFKILPKLRELDPDEAAAVAASANLQGGIDAGNGIKFTSSMTLENVDDPSEPTVAATLAKHLQGGALSQVRSLSKNDPDDAFGLLTGITDPEYRVEALSSIAAGYAETNPPKARQLLDAAIALLDKIKDTVASVHAMVSVAKAAIRLGQMSTFAQVIQGAFDLGQENVSEDLDLHPTKVMYMADNMDDLGSLVRLDVQANPSNDVQRLSRVHDEVLRAYLLIDYAIGLKEWNLTHGGEPRANQ